MNENEMVMLFWEKIVKYITVITPAVSLLTFLFSSVEYMRRKGRWDFYFVDKKFRTPLKEVFGLENFIATFLVVLFVSFLMILLKTNSIMNCLPESYYIVVLFLLAFLIFLGVAWFCRMNIVRQGIYSKKEFRRRIIIYAFVITIEYLIQIMIFSRIYYLIIKFHYVTILLYLVLGGISLIFFEYYKVKMFLPGNRIYDITCLDGETYCIICLSSNGSYYAVKADINNNKIYLYLGVRVLIEPCGQKIETRVFNEMVRVFNGREIHNRF